MPSRPRKNIPPIVRLAIFRAFLYSFQGRRPARARQGLCPNQKASICPTSKQFHGHLPVNSPPPSRLVWLGCRAYPAGSGKARIRCSMLPNMRRVRCLPYASVSTYVIFGHDKRFCFEMGATPCSLLRLSAIQRSSGCCEQQPLDGMRNQKLSRRLSCNCRGVVAREVI